MSEYPPIAGESAESRLSDSIRHILEGDWTDYHGINRYDDAHRGIEEAEEASGYAYWRLRPEPSTEDIYGDTEDRVAAEWLSYLIMAQEDVSEAHAEAQAYESGED